MNSFEETQSQRSSETHKKAISVIRIKPSEMSRVRKESEKYADNGDEERREVIHRGYRSARGNGGGGGRQRKTSYDPDYDRSVTFRSRHDSENERKIMLMGQDHHPPRHR